MSWAGQRRLGKKPHISSRRNHVSKPFWQGRSRRFLRDSLRLQKVCECMRACVGVGLPRTHLRVETDQDRQREWRGMGRGGLSGLIFVGLFLTFC